MKLDEKNGGSKIMSASDYEALADKSQVVGKYVTKETFFALTTLRDMTDPGAAETTYARWLVSRRVVEVVTVEQDPTGLIEDKTTVLIEARFVNAEKRRENINRRTNEQTRAMLAESMFPGALQQV